MLLPQGQRLGSERVVFGGTSRAGPISGLQRVRRVAKSLEQVSDRAGTEIQGVGDGRRGLAAAGSKHDEAPECRR